jgi:uncharacterized protein YbjT (DUF2867 family)
LTPAKDIPEPHPDTNMAQPKSKENLLIIGATGYIGVYIVEQIIKAKDSFGRIAIFTSPSTAESKPQKLVELRAQGVEVIIGDIKKPSDLVTAFEGPISLPTQRSSH